MDAIWSFCGETFFKDYHPRWYTPKHCWYSWILSLGTVSKFYPETTLYTDKKGAQWLVEKLGLNFRNIVINLNFMKDKNPQWWCYSKLKAYASHPRPFIHFDSDVFLWKKLPEELELAPVVGQNFETLLPYYRIGLLEQNAQKVGGWLPKEFYYYKTYHPKQPPINCGIMGGNNLSFIQYYANLGMVFIDGNSPLWNLYDELIKESCLTEQYFLAACIYYYKNRDHSFGDVTPVMLFKEEWQPWNDEIAKQVGYTHLLGESKGNKDIAERLEKRVRDEYPLQYENVLIELSQRA